MKHCVLNFYSDTLESSVFWIWIEISAVMDGDWLRICVFMLTTSFLQEGAALKLRNELLGKCVQLDGESQEKLTLEECNPGSGFQEWQWNPETRSLRNPHTGKCLTALKIQDQGTVGLSACRAEDDETQAWSCSKKGHLILYGKGFHLSVRSDSSDIFLSTERGKSSKWKTLNERTMCEEPPDEPKKIEPKIIAKIRLWQSQVNLDQDASKPTQASHVPTVFSQLNSNIDELDSGAYVNPLSMEYGLEWKVTMLVLSSVALVIGMVILFLSIYQNRRKKTVVVLKSYTSTGEASQPGSPVTNERAPLTKHPMKPPRSPSIQRGEIMVEWKDGTVTPLFDTYQTS
ncbi:uncharacterized protein si:dkey-245n4.2 [Tachysurus fulvidraco]|uniref:uncharacterized protein si:dkey-245n4.2 n=1 Tax=Tachysurus fulvidraco TaxID=1234273 RepID=UPI001FED2B16|nr:uncharacterized protein si:dkey-245n4.2 [Tachysurus fulvidraco]